MKGTPPNVILVGMMGSGKTEMGRIVAKRLSREFVDVDRMIVDSVGVEISEIFKYGGEKYFRMQEYRALYSLRCKDTCVISTGGGIITMGRSRRLLVQMGVVIYLKVAVPILVDRLVNSGDQRPLLKGRRNVGKLVEKLLSERERYYQEISDEVVEASPKSTKYSVAGQIISRLERMGYA